MVSKIDSLKLQELPKTVEKDSAATKPKTNAADDELAKLLSKPKTNNNPEKEIKPIEEKSWFDKKSGDLLAAGLTSLMTLACGHATGAFAKLAPTKTGKALAAVYGLGTLFAAGLTAYLVGRKPYEAPPAKQEAQPQAVPAAQPAQAPKPQDAQGAKETKNTKYAPKSGEYWTGIIQAKYGVDYDTALEMSHRIKDVIYDDSLASKQSPLMYLPKVWEFKGKTYHLNDAEAAPKGELSDKVKTEMGKMNKDIDYGN